jgi:hypothetical protein
MGATRLTHGEQEANDMHPTQRRKSNRAKKATSFVGSDFCINRLSRVSSRRGGEDICQD